MTSSKGQLRENCSCSDLLWHWSVYSSYSKESTLAYPEIILNQALIRLFVLLYTFSKAFPNLSSSTWWSGPRTCTTWKTRRLDRKPFMTTVYLSRLIDLPQRFTLQEKPSYLRMTPLNRPTTRWRRVAWCVSWAWTYSKAQNVLLSQKKFLMCSV